MKKFYSTVFLLSMVVMGCTPSTIQKSFTTEEIAFTLTGPLFAGANAAQVVLSPSFEEMLGEGKTAEDLISLHLSSATFTSTDSIPFQYWEGIVLQLVSDNSPMVNAGVLNPIPSGKSTVTLTGSTEADLADVVKDGTFYVVADINLEEDIMDRDLEFSGVLNFDIAVKE